MTLPRFSLDELRGFLDGRVGRHEMPAALEFRDALPRTPVGKLSKIDLKQEEAARHQAATVKSRSRMKRRTAAR